MPYYEYNFYLFFGIQNRGFHDATMKKGSDCVDFSGIKVVLMGRDTMVVIVARTRTGRGSIMV